MTAPQFVDSNTVPDDQVRLALVRVLASGSFESSPQLCRFLTYLVNETLGGHQEHLKESVLGMEVFGRPPGYDPKLDGVVRAEARRLRAKLAEYYLNEGEEDEVVVEVPKGSYVPAFRLRAGNSTTDAASASEAGSASENAPDKNHLRWWLTAAALVAVIAGLLTWRTHTRSIGPKPSGPLVLAFLPIESPAGAGDFPPYLASGLTDVIKMELSQSAGLRVLASVPNSAVQESQGDYRKLGERLGAAFIARGSLISRAHSKVLHVELIRAADGTYEWSRDFELNQDNSSHPERDVVETVADTLHVNTGLNLPETKDAEAHNLYLEGMYLMTMGGAQNVKRAVMLYQQAIDRDPGYALPYSSMSFAYAAMAANRQIDRGAGLSLAVAAATQALKLAPNLAQPHCSLGLIRALQWNIPEAEREYRRAIELNPSYGRAYYLLGLLLYWRGHFEEADRVWRESSVLEPLALRWMETRAIFLLNTRHYQEAISVCEHLMASNPTDADCSFTSAQSYYKMHQYEKAYQVQKAGVALHPGNETLRLWLACYMAGVGQREAALQVITELERKHAQDPQISEFNFAGVYSQLGDKDKSFEWLHRSFQDHELQLFEIRWVTSLDNIRDDPRYAEFLKQIPISD